MLSARTRLLTARSTTQVIPFMKASKKAKTILKLLVKTNNTLKAKIEKEASSLPQFQIHTNNTQKQMENNDFSCFLWLVWDEDGAYYRQVGTNLGELGPKLVQVGSKLVQVGPKLAPSWPKLAPSWLQVGPKLAQVGPKTAQRVLTEGP